tara:strand:- start:402 stop:764 length:363 start_codon:yes stop_codon:yes gene_type:complete
MKAGRKTLREGLTDVDFDWATGELVVSMNEWGDPCLYGEEDEVTEKRHYSFREGITPPIWVNNLLSVSYGLGLMDEDMPLVVLADKSAIYVLVCPDPGISLQRIEKNIQRYLPLDKRMTL